MIRSESKRLFAKDITGTITANRQVVDVEWRAGTLVIDEPKFNGGQDLGPDPFTMIVAGLVGCTLTTLRMYIRRKGWQIEDITVHANLVQQQEPFRTIILRTVVVGQSITEEQGEKLLHIAKNCPAARLLEGEIVIDTVLDGTFSE
jgi:putative redox protein